MNQQEYEQAVNRTCRESGAVGRNPVVYRYMTEHGDRSKWVLDYGAGKRAKHATHLKLSGFNNIKTWEIGSNFTPGIHDPWALYYQYDYVLASNVLNVQPDLVYVNMLLRNLAKLTKDDGMTVINYPGSPRAAGLTNAEMHRLLFLYFSEVKEIKKSAPLYLCTKPIRGRADA